MFPLKKGSNHAIIKDLQVALSNKFATPASMKIGSPTTYWGEKTQALIEYHGLPSVIQTREELDAILAGQKPQSTQATASSASALPSNWKDTIKNPNAVLGLLGNLSNIRQNLGGRNQNTSPQTQMPVSMPADFQTFPQQQPQPQRRNIPTVVWVAGGLVILVIILFLLLK
jgi:hypothetical protein